MEEVNTAFLGGREEPLDTEPSFMNQQAMNQFTSTLYSGPTIQDIEKALSITSRRDQVQAVSQARISLSKTENHKYTLKLKSCGNEMTDDGYKWRKYGQKAIKNNPHPRSYYKCTNPRCGAKKQVERSSDEQDTLIVTYEGLHLHFIYPYFLLDQSERQPPKKLKRTILGSEPQPHELLESSSHPPNSAGLGSSETIMASQGLLEDVVPFSVRNPTSNIVPSTFFSSRSSYPSPPTSPTSSSSLSWSPVKSHFCLLEIEAYANLCSLDLS